MLMKTCARGHEITNALHCALHRLDCPTRQATLLPGAWARLRRPPRAASHLRRRERLSECPKRHVEATLPPVADRTPRTGSKAVTHRNRETDVGWQRGIERGRSRRQKTHSAIACVVAGALQGQCRHPTRAWHHWPCVGRDGRKRSPRRSHPCRSSRAMQGQRARSGVQQQSSAATELRCSRWCVRRTEDGAIGS